jgi:hypothetical protein
VLIVLTSVTLNLLEPSGPVTACNGIASPLIEDRNAKHGTAWYSDFIGRKVKPFFR